MLRRNTHKFPLLLLTHTQKEIFVLCSNNNNFRLDSFFFFLRMEEKGVVKKRRKVFLFLMPWDLGKKKREKSSL